MNFKNKHGQVNFTIENNIIIATFSGNLDAELLLAFKVELLKSVEEFKNQHWGYISDSSGVLAATPEAEQAMVEISRAMQQKNCFISAFVLTSSIAINQMQRIMDNAGREVNFKDCLFTELSLAKRYITDNLKNAQAD